MLRVGLGGRIGRALRNWPRNPLGQSQEHLLLDLAAMPQGRPRSAVSAEAGTRHSNLAAGRNQIHTVVYYGVLDRPSAGITPEYTTEREESVWNWLTKIGRKRGLPPRNKENGGQRNLGRRTTGRATQGKTVDFILGNHFRIHTLPCTAYRMPWDD